MIMPYAILAIAGISACFDLTAARIPNGILLAGLASGVFARLRVFSIFEAGAAPAGMPVLVAGAAGMAVPVLLLVLFWHHRMIGGGDVKLLAVIGFYTGPEDILWIMFWSFAAAAVISVGILYANGSGQERLVYFLSYIRNRSRKGGVRPYRQGAQTGTISAGSEMHFAVAVLMAVMMYTGGARP